MTQSTPEEDTPRRLSAPASLTGTEGGIWKVSTQTSHYIFDLDLMTVTRHAGPGAGTTINDRTRPIKVIWVCEVGKIGFWTMVAEPHRMEFIEHYRQITTVVTSIEQVTSDDGEQS